MSSIDGCSVPSGRRTLEMLTSRRFATSPRVSAAIHSSSSPCFSDDCSDTSGFGIRHGQPNPLISDRRGKPARISDLVKDRPKPCQMTALTDAAPRLDTPSGNPLTRALVLHRFYPARSSTITPPTRSGPCFSRYVPSRIERFQTLRSSRGTTSSSGACGSVVRCMAWRSRHRHPGAQTASTGRTTVASMWPCTEKQVPKFDRNG